MEEAKGVVRHVLVAKFKDEIPPEKIEELIKGYARLVSLIEPMKSFHWYSSLLLNLFNPIHHPTALQNRTIDTHFLPCLDHQLRDDSTFATAAKKSSTQNPKQLDVSQENLHQGFTHVFESTFESAEGVAEYVAHPAHVEFANSFLPTLEKVIVIDYKPTHVLL
ncbi:hypothetical protein ACLOJK_039162 [Asimina triloba]